MFKNQEIGRFVIVAGISFIRPHPGQPVYQSILTPREVARLWSLLALGDDFMVVCPDDTAYHVGKGLEGWVLVTIGKAGSTDLELGDTKRMTADEFLLLISNQPKMVIGISWKVFEGLRVRDMGGEVVDLTWGDLDIP